MLFIFIQFTIDQLWNAMCCAWLQAMAMQPRCNHECRDCILHQLYPFTFLRSICGCLWPGIVAVHDRLESTIYEVLSGYHPPPYMSLEQWPYVEELATTNQSENFNFTLKNVQQWKEAPMDGMVLVLYRLSETCNTEITHGLADLGDYVLCEGLTVDTTAGCRQCLAHRVCCRW